MPISPSNVLPAAIAPPAPIEEATAPIAAAAGGKATLAATATPPSTSPIPVPPLTLFHIPSQSLPLLDELVPSECPQLVPSVMERDNPFVFPSDKLKDLRDSACPFMSLHWNNIPSTSELSIGSATTR